VAIDLNLEREAQSPISVASNQAQLVNPKPRLAIELPQSVLGVDVFRCYEHNCYSSPIRWWTGASYKVHVHGFLLFVYVS